MSINLVKIHATASTNDELKVRFRESELPALTTIYTIHQTAGKGQMGARWHSEPNKNLTFSFLLTNELREFTDFQINKFVTVVVVEWLREKLHIQAYVKWPNDILSVHHKLAGILIENLRQSQQRHASIVGIGLNVNQLQFPRLPKAISLTNLTAKTYDLELLLIDFMTFMQQALDTPFEVIIKYENYLYKLNQMARFELNGQIISAYVKEVNSRGQLVLLRDNVQSTYDVKEIKWIY